MALPDAFAQLPVRVSELFAQTKLGTTSADEVVTALNAAYGHALSDNDTLSFTCTDREAAAQQRHAVARGGFAQADQALKQLQKSILKQQEGIDDALAEVEALREQFTAQRAACQRNEQRGVEALQLLAADLPLAQGLVQQAEQSCGAGGTPPGLIECSLPDGSFVVTFQEQGLRDQVVQLSGLAERLLASRLDQTVGSLAAVHSAATLLLQEHTGRHRRLNGTARAHAVEPAQAAVSLLESGRASRKLMRRAIPDRLCTKAVAPACESLADNMASFVGGVRDLTDEVKAHSQAASEQCRVSLEDYTAKIDNLKRQAEDASSALADLVAQQSDVQSWRRERQKFLQEVDAAVQRGRAACSNQLLAAQGAMCSARRVYGELVGATSVFSGSCEVSGWVAAGPCSLPCGSGGLQNVTRQVVKAPPQNAGCPDLEASQPCNERPCPIDALMSQWQEWSECTRACGGGTRARSRSMVRQAAQGGELAGDTVEDQACNAYPCDQDCVLTEWSGWSNCSKVCESGHQTRTRHVLRQALGSGSCPAEESPSRRQAMVCHRKACPSTPAPQCASLLDLALVLDNSGSMGSQGFLLAKGFVQAMTEKIKLGDGDVATGTAPLARVGAVSFAASATVLQPLTADGGALTQSLAGAAWAKTATNTGEAVYVAAEMLERYRRVHAQQVVLVVTDGMPLSSYVMSVEAARLKQRGVRLAFVLVGSTLTRQPFEGWASWPKEENVLSIRSFTALQEAATVTSVLANFCPTLA